MNATGFFNHVDFDFIGLQQIIQLWDKTRHTISAVMQTKKLSPYPEMPGVTEAYLAIVPLKDFVENVLMDGDRKLRVHIFEENVRAFLGRKNPVNKQIYDTLARQSWLNLHSIDPGGRKLQAEGKMSPLFPVNLDNQNCKR